MDKARDAGMRISVDPASAALLLDDPAFLDRARPVDLLLPNEDEFAALGGDLPGVAEFVIKRGRDGASWSDGRRTLTHQGRAGRRRDRHHRRRRRVRRRLPERWPGDPEHALAAGVALAAQAVAQEGGRPA